MSVIPGYEPGSDLNSVFVLFFVLFLLVLVVLVVVLVLLGVVFLVPVAVARCATFTYTKTTPRTTKTTAGKKIKKYFGPNYFLTAILFNLLNPVDAQTAIVVRLTVVKIVGISVTTRHRQDQFP